MQLVMVSGFVVLVFILYHSACRNTVLCLFMSTFNHDCVDSIVFMVNKPVECHIFVVLNYNYNEIYNLLCEIHHLINKYVHYSIIYL